MGKYIMVIGGDQPNLNGCRYLSSIDKDGLHFSQDLDDAIVIYDSEKCVFLARALTRVFHTVDVYSVKEETFHIFGHIW